MAALPKETDDQYEGRVAGLLSDTWEALLLKIMNNGSTAAEQKVLGLIDRPDSAKYQEVITRITLLKDNPIYATHWKTIRDLHLEGLKGDTYKKAIYTSLVKQTLPQLQRLYIKHAPPERAEEEFSPPQPIDLEPPPSRTMGKKRQGGNVEDLYGQSAYKKQSGQMPFRTLPAADLPSLPMAMTLDLPKPRIGGKSAGAGDKVISFKTKSGKTVTFIKKPSPKGGVKKEKKTKAFNRRKQRVYSTKGSGIGADMNDLRNTLTRGSQRKMGKLTSRPTAVQAVSAYRKKNGLNVWDTIKPIKLNGPTYQKAFVRGYVRRGYTRKAFNNKLGHWAAVQIAPTLVRPHLTQVSDYSKSKIRGYQKKSKK